MKMGKLGTVQAYYNEQPRVFLEAEDSSTEGVELPRSRYGVSEREAGS